MIHHHQTFSDLYKSTGLPVTSQHTLPSKTVLYIPASPHLLPTFQHFTPYTPTIPQFMPIDSELAVAVASFVIAVVALVGALLQLMLSVNIEARRKGKRDRLALGDWAISNPELKLLIHYIYRRFGLKSPWGDPRMTVPFITVGEMEKYLEAESRAHKRPDLARRMSGRLVVEASNALSTGGGKYTGRMYAVRETTRKMCEACWSDAMNMCGMTREFWNLRTTASAQACDGQVRPANAVTNLHSLCGFGRIMGLREVKKDEKRITMTNGGASLYLDLTASVDRPTRIAHFSGSPNGRYLVVEEMSQHTAYSIYADAVWSTGCIPDEARLSPVSREPKPKFSTKSLNIPSQFPDASPTTTLQLGQRVIWNDSLESWARGLVALMKPPTTRQSNLVGMLDLVDCPVVLSCIRTYPWDLLSQAQKSACGYALSWCIRYWTLCPFQCGALKYHPSGLRPRLPILGIDYIGPEFITSPEQSREWYQLTINTYQNDTIVVDETVWNHIVEFAGVQNQTTTTRGNWDSSTLTFQERMVLVKLLQIWKLFVWEEAGRYKAFQHASASAGSQDQTSAILVALTMATITVATDSCVVGDSEHNKAVEIEFG